MKSLRWCVLALTGLLLVSACSEDQDENLTPAMNFSDDSNKPVPGPQELNDAKQLSGRAFRSSNCTLKFDWDGANDFMKVESSCGLKTQLLSGDHSLAFQCTGTHSCNSVYNGDFYELHFKENFRDLLIVRHQSDKMILLGSESFWLLPF